MSVLSLNFTPVCARKAVCIFLYKMYIKTLDKKDEVVRREREHLLKLLVESQEETNKKDDTILKLQDSHRGEIVSLNTKHQNTVSELLKEHNTIALKTVEALMQVSNLIEGDILNKMSIESQLTRESLNVMRADIMGKIEGLSGRI